MTASSQQYQHLFKTYLGPQKWRVVILGIFIFTNLGLQLLIPQIMRDFIDSVTQDAAMGHLVRLGAYFLGVAFLQQVIAILTAYYTQSIGWQATNALREDLTKHALNLDMSFHKAHPPGEMISRIDSDINNLNDFFSQFLLKILGNLLLVTAILVLLFLEDWRLGLTLTLFSLVALFILIRFRNIAVPHWEAERKAEANFYSFLEERLAGTADVRANGGRAYTMQQFFGLIREMYQRSIKAGMKVNVMLNSMFLIFAIGTAVSLGVGGTLYLREIITIGTVYIAYQYNQMLQRPLEDISRQIANVQKALASTRRIFELMGIESRIKSPSAMPAVSLLSDGKPLAVQFDHVSFYYDDAPRMDGGKTATLENAAAPVKSENVLEDIHFTLSPGEVLGLLGRTGSGKTTLTRLIFRLYEPQQGQIRLGKTIDAWASLKEIPLPLLRDQIGMVTQSIELFHASVRDNLTFFATDISDERILSTLHMLGLSHWYAGLKNGLDTILESGGSGLSAGEAQLLAFTRIFLKDPSVVVLDEASSRLDPATEHLIEKAVDRLVKNRTALIIAHRLKTVQRADKIMILENNHVIEYGDREQLALDPKSRFHQLLQTGLDEVLA
jgi:ATP-binding cassette subfamily B protein/ATP-binding cassette subfamily C protein